MAWWSIFNKDNAAESGEFIMEDGNQENDSSDPSVAASPYWGASTAPTRTKGFSPVVGFCFTINYILGTGFLTIPWAFGQGGLVLSTLVLMIVGVFSDMAKNYLLETMARAEVMLDNRLHWIERRPGDDQKEGLVYSPLINNRTGPLSSSAASSSTTDPLSAEGARDYESIGQQQPPRQVAFTFSMQTTPLRTPPSTPTRNRRLQRRPPPKYLIQRRKFEVNSLCRVFVGKPGLRIYTAIITLYLYCTLWAYTSVFASAMAKAVPWFVDENTNYLAFAGVFASLVVPLSCMELDEQVAVQVCMTGARFLMLALMVGTSSLCARASTNEDASTTEIPLFRWAGTHKMLPIVTFAHIYHHSIPGLAHTVKDKTKLGGMFQATTAFSTVAYSFIGIVLASAFGNTMEQSANLNWQSFTGGVAVDDENGIVAVPWWAKAVSIYVLCFPALDVVSAFPLNTITLGNNMMGSYFGKRLPEVEHDRWIRTRFRLLACIPPIILGILERQLGTITDYAGTTGFVIGFSFPAMLYIRSRKSAKEKHFRTSTFYDSYASSASAAWCLFYFGLAMVLYVVVFLVLGNENDAQQ